MRSIRAIYTALDTNRRIHLFVILVSLVIAVIYVGHKRSHRPLTSEERYIQNWVELMGSDGEGLEDYNEVVERLNREHSDRLAERLGDGYTQYQMEVFINTGEVVSDEHR
jgi:hypothetical protein